MVELAAHYEIAVLLVTHDLDEASYLSDRVLILGGMPSRLQHELAVPLTRDRGSAEPAYLRGEALTELCQSRCEWTLHGGVLFRAVGHDFLSATHVLALRSPDLDLSIATHNFCEQRCG